MPHVELPQAEFKVVMLGDTNTGKTSLVLRFAEGYYREEARSSTVGAFFITKRLQVHGITCKIQIWDTAGQEQFKCMAPMYYRNAAAAIVCYDVTSPSSYQTMRFWLDELHRNIPAGSIVICIAATKTDLLRPEMDLAQAEQMAHAMGAMFVDTSAKTNTNVISLFRKVAERVLQFKQDTTKIPVTPGASIDERGMVSQKKPLLPHKPRRDKRTKNSLLKMEQAATTTTNGTTAAVGGVEAQHAATTATIETTTSTKSNTSNNTTSSSSGAMCMEPGYMCGMSNTNEKDAPLSCIIL